MSRKCLERCTRWPGDPDAVPHQPHRGAWGEYYLHDVSPDGGRIVFRSYRNGDGDLSLMNADGSEETHLVGGGGQNAHPRWLPDGSRIVFESNRNGTYEIYVINADGTGLRNLTNHPANEPNGTWGW